MIPLTVVELANKLDPEEASEPGGGVMSEGRWENVSCMFCL